MTLLLMPCPFCNKYEIIFCKADDGYFGYLSCVNRNCLTMGPMAYSENFNKKEIIDSAIKKWNRRKRSGCSLTLMKEVKVKTKSHDSIICQ